MALDPNKLLVDLCFLDCRILPTCVQVRKLTNAPKVADDGGITSIPKRSSSLPAPRASIPGSDAALMRAHSSADDAAAELLSPTAPTAHGQVWLQSLTFLQHAA